MRPLPVKLSKRAEFDFRSKLFGSEPDSRHAKIAPDFTPGDNDFKHFQFERRVERFFLTAYIIQLNWFSLDSSDKST